MTRYVVTRANSLVFGAAVAILVLLGLTTWDRLEAAHDARLWWQHTYNVLGSVKELDLAVHDAETGQRGFLLTGNPLYLKPYDQALARVSFLQGELQRLTADNDEEQSRLAALSPLIQHKMDELAQTIALRRDSGLGPALVVVESNLGLNLMTSIKATLAAMTTEEQALLAKRLATVDRRASLVRWLVFGGGVFAIAALLAAAWMLNRAWARSYGSEQEQRTTAMRLRASLDSLSQGVGVFDAERRLTNWNECFQVLLAVPRGMLRTGTPYVAFVEQLMESGVLLETEDQLRHGRNGPREVVVYERARKNGHELELRRTPMPEGGFVLTITDMTKRAQAEAVLREAQKMQAIGQLTGGIAHDFNNLLTVIIGNLEVVRARLEGNQALELRLERAAWAAQRGATLTAQLLAFARKQPLAPSAIDLAASMPDLVPLLRRTLGERIDVRYVETAGLWHAMADAAQLESAVLNLALNARDAMPEGGRLTIELANKVLDEDYARRHAEVVPGDYTMLAVSDTGHGMEPAVAARVFEPFFTTKLDGKGTGLGLAMVFGFVKQSGGHVKVYSEPGHGTTIRLYLPRAKAGLLPVIQRSDVPVEMPRGTATILVVEDEPAVREIAVAILGDLGYRVLEAADGEEGLRVFGAHMAEIDLVLTDVVLPGKLRGRDMADRITEIRPKVRVLFMSGYTENSIVHHGRLDDGVHLIGKPFKRDQLARKVADLLGDAAVEARDDARVVELKPRRDG
jgi:signal transduction histidine kinase/FixJ family two-component response regulator